jgi:hypothetical protein
MAPPRSDSIDDAYPGALRAAEEAQVHLRRTQSHVDPDAPLVGVALSGGGIRSATFCIGFFQALARKKLVRRIDYISTASGGGYFGSFLGAAFSRDKASAEKIEAELADNHSWSIQWLRDNGRFLSPNGAGDSWIAAAVMLRNWVALHIVMITFAFFLFGFGVLVRAELSTSLASSANWVRLERGIWSHHILGIWWSPWLLLPGIPFATLMFPAGCLYWLTQFTPLMIGLRRLGALFSKKCTAYSNREFVSYAQNWLTEVLVIGFIPTVVLLGFALVDSLGQTAYWKWSAGNFEFPAMWAALTGLGFGIYGFAAKIYILAENLLGKGKLKLTFDTIALFIALAWLLLIVTGVSVAACSIAWQNERVAVDGRLQPMIDPWILSVAVAITLGLSCIFSRSFSFVNLSSLQQVYAARLRRAYIGATNPNRQASENYSMTDLIAGDDFCMEDYQPQTHGGPLHLINVTVNETLSAKTQIERCDRKGVPMSVGPCGISVGTSSHALWSAHHFQPRRRMLMSALWEDPARTIIPLDHGSDATFHALQTSLHPTSVGQHHAGAGAARHVEALSLGRWTAISGAAFTTGLGAGTHLGLSLLLGLANVRLGYWWDGGVPPSQRKNSTKPTFLELAGRLVNWVLPVQTCLVNEFFARFHGPARRHWYLSDGGHFENTACYELIRRRVPFIICTDGGQDPNYQFPDLANLVRKARTDFGAEIEVIRRAHEPERKEPGHSLPSLEQLVHPAVLDLFGSPEDFPVLHEDASANDGRQPAGSRHALLARIRYVDTGETGWLLLVKPSLAGDEPVDVVQYQRTHSLFPQEPTSDQYFDEAQWESYRKLGEHIGASLFVAPEDNDPRWSPSRFAAPEIALSNRAEASASRSPIDTQAEAVSSQ